MKVITVTLLVSLAVSAYARVPGKVTPIGVEECPQEQETDWTIEWLMRHEDCNRFYKCTFGKPVEYRCYGNLFFNLETWQCDWPENVDCEDRNIPDSVEDVAPSTSSTTTTTEATTTTTTPAPTTTTTTTTTPAPTTTTSTTTTTTPAPTTTTSTTTTTTPAPTTTTSTTTTTTPAPTTTTPTTTTTTPAPTTTTSSTTTTTAAPTTITTEATTKPDIEFLENGCPVDPTIHWLLPHENDCNLFYYCVWGKKVLRNCPGVLHFNTELQVCDHQVDAGCTLPGPNSFGQWLQNLL